MYFSLHMIVHPTRSSGGVRPSEQTYLQDVGKPSLARGLHALNVLLHEQLHAGLLAGRKDRVLLGHAQIPQRLLVAADPLYDLLRPRAGSDH